MPSHRSISAPSVPGASAASCSVRSRADSSPAASTAAARTSSLELRSDTTCGTKGRRALDGGGAALAPRRRCALPPRASHSAALSCAPHHALPCSAYLAAPGLTPPHPPLHHQQQHNPTPLTSRSSRPPPDSSASRRCPGSRDSACRALARTSAGVPFCRSACTATDSRARSAGRAGPCHESARAHGRHACGCRRRARRDDKGAYLFSSDRACRNGGTTACLPHLRRSAAPRAPDHRRAALAPPPSRGCPAAAAPR